MADIDLTFTFVPPKIDHAKISQAIARGINEAGDKVRTRVQQRLKVQTNVKSYRSITSRIRTVRAFPGSFHYDIVTASKPMPITEMPVEVTARGIDARSWGHNILFKRSFDIEGRFVARVSSPRFPIHRLKGPNLAKEFERNGLPEVFQRASAEFVAPMVLKHIARAIG